MSNGAGERRGVGSARDGAGAARRGGLAALVAGGAALAGGLLLLVGKPKARGEGVEGGVVPAGADSSGRGRPGVPASRSARRAGHETVDASARAATAVLGVFAVVAVATVLLAVVGLGWLHRADRAALPPLTTEQRASVEPPEPRLQENPMGDIAAVRAREEALLTGYAWADAEHTHVRVPIARAMALMVGRPLDPQP